MDLDGTTESVATEGTKIIDDSENEFIPPSINKSTLLAGESYTYHSPIPDLISGDMGVECCLGIDEAGRGPVLGN
jgi:ribonuclease H2 subunit A